MGRPNTIALPEPTIAGIGTVGGFGCGTADLEKALVAGPKPYASVTMDATGGPIEVPAFLTDTARLSDYCNLRTLRRTDHFTRMALLACFLALDDAGVLDTTPRLGIVLATGYGATCNTFDFKDSMVFEGDICGSPTKFANSVHNAAAAQIAIFLNQRGPNLTLSQYDMSVPQAFFTARQWLAEKRVDAVLVGGVDEYCKVLGYYWHCLYGTAANQTIPSQWRHAIIGEGAAFFLLTADSSVNGRISKINMGRLAGGSPTIETTGAAIIATDGYSGMRDRYTKHIAKQTPTGIYAGVYGAMPVAMVFDVTIAALSLRNRTFYPSPEPRFGLADHLNLAPLSDHTPTDITCLKLGAADTFGQITVRAGHAG